MAKEEKIASLIAIHNANPEGILHLGSFERLLLD